MVPPNCCDSDIELEDDDDLDDEALDPEFFLNLPDDLIPTASGKQWN